ncbi:hypothetical protein [Nocardioides sp. LHG3406-4]|uniref:hypothetical protein n=1 Tax=Nocardioides sp. LHG3406-4 TaxID=2804575 RepID=UPI003CF9C1DC
MFGGERARRRRTARELERRLRELDELDRRFGLGALPPATAPRRARHPVRTFWVVVLTAALLAIVVAIHPSDTMAQVRALAGFGGPDGSGSHAFFRTQPPGREPVGYDPCQVIEVRVNPDGAPRNWETLVRTSIEHVSDASGLHLSYEGTTDSRDFRGRGGERAPVLVGWATEDEIPDLAGAVAGLGGSTAVESRPGHLEYVTGTVVLDWAAFDGLEPGRGTAIAQAVVDHEFGHLVGLDHVEDPDELMNAETTGRQLTWGPGDLEGLARLGAIDCG